MLNVALAALPGVVTLAVLAALGALGVGAALLAAAVVAAATWLSMQPLLRGITSVGRAANALADDEAAAVPTVRSASPTVEALWLAVARFARACRQRIRAREAQLATAEAILSALPEPLFLLDSRRRVVRANSLAAEWFGPHVAGRDLAAVLRNPAVLAAADAVLRGEGRRTADFTLVLSVERHLTARIAPIEHRRAPGDEAADGGGREAGIAAVLTLHDLTGVKRTEQMRADFVANASHELRTPLATLIGFIETLRGPARDDPEAQSRFLGIMHQQASRMARLIDDLLSLSRIEMNEHQPPTGRVTLGPLLRSVADTLELRAEARRMRIELTLPDGLPPIQGEADELAQVFQNLIDNAIKYGRPGTPIEVVARMTDRRVGPGAAPLQPSVAVSVRDHGDGIPREHLPRLTERFYRIDPARSREMGGTGLGLAIVKHIVNRHRGQLEIESGVGSGSAFTVYLRAAAAA
jgi:two-component system phosphate regulon sensor histidine kinase PhoR